MDAGLAGEKHMSQVHNPLHTPLISDLPEPSVSGSHAVATSPAVEQEIRPEAARPAAMPVAVQLQGAQKRLDRLLGRASGNLPCLTGSVYAELARNIPRPGLFSGLRRTHGPATRRPRLWRAFRPAPLPGCRFPRRC